MKQFTKIIVLALFLASASSQAFAAAAGKGHSHIASETKIIRNAKNTLEMFIVKQKIGKTWSKAKLVSAQKRGQEWVVNFQNSAILDKTKQNLYIYLTSYGKMKGATFTKQ